MKYLNIIKEKGFKYGFDAFRSIVRKIIFISFIKFFYKNNKESYSQYCEDLFIDMVLKSKENGSYIDIGANNPEVINNTKRFYDRGWRGVNIEPNTVKYQEFLQFRPMDINLNIGLGAVQGEMTFYSFQTDTLSTFSKEVAEKAIGDGQKLLDQIPVKILTLNDVFAMLNNDRVDFISIDTEGFEFEVLSGNDWAKHRATVICIEDESGRGFDDFFNKIDYRRIVNNGLNTFYFDKKYEIKNT